MPYHAGVLVVVLVVAVLGALPANTHPHLVSFAYYFEVLLAVFFFFEFCVRLWAIGADAKYRGLKGRFRYLRRLVGIADILIIMTTIFILVFSYTGHNQSLLEKMSFELISAYYLSCLLFLLLAFSVYELESYSEEFNRVNVTEEKTFPTFGHSMWFSVVSSLTIGYGDIVPKYWMSKVVTCVLAYCAYALFVAASTLVSVAVTMLMADETRHKKQSKLRHMSAKVIQIWCVAFANNHCGRESLYTSLLHFVAYKKLQKFRDMCLKLSKADESLKRSRLIAKKLAERANKMAQKQSRRKEKHTTVDALDLKSTVRLALAKQALEPVNLTLPSLQMDSMPPPPSPAFHRQKAAFSNHELLRYHSLSLFGKRGVLVPGLSAGSQPLTRNPSTESSSTGSDIDDLYHAYHTIHSTNSFRPSVDTAGGQLLRLLHYFMFRRILNKFKRARKPYELMDAEAELCEMEHLRMQKVQLETRLESVIGISTMSPFLKDSDRPTIAERLQVCEEKLSKLEEDALQILDMAQHIREFHQTAGVTLAAEVTTGLLSARIAKLPPPPPLNPERAKISKRKSRLSRQSPIAK